MTTTEAAPYVRLSPRTLERHRVTGEGPQFLKVGRLVFNRQADLDKWLEKTVRRSISDPGSERDEEAKKTGGATALGDAPAEVPDTASPVGPRLGAAGQLSAGDAARPFEVSPRFAVCGCAVVRHNRMSGASEVLTEAGADAHVAQRRGRRRPPPDQWVGACGRRRRSGRSASLLERSPRGKTSA